MPRRPPLRTTSACGCCSCISSERTVMTLWHVQILAPGRAGWADV